jgi:pyruvate,water dikinase
VDEGRRVVSAMAANGLTQGEAVRWLISRAIAAAKRLGKPIGICGQAPSDYPEFAAWLVKEGIDSISLNPDVAIATTIRVADAERAIGGAVSERGDAVPHPLAPAC